jgi:hypothetical protein
MSKLPFLAIFFEPVSAGGLTRAGGTTTITEAREEPDTDEDLYGGRALPRAASVGTVTCTRAREEDDADFSPASAGTTTFTKEREESDTDSPLELAPAMWECGIL